VEQFHFLKAKAMPGNDNQHGRYVSLPRQAVTHFLIYAETPSCLLGKLVLSLTALWRPHLNKNILYFRLQVLANCWT